MNYIANKKDYIKSLDLVEYKGSIAAGSYEEFTEWARLVYILENL